MSMLVALGLSLLTVQPDRAIMAHYMPWYVGKPLHKEWGWHWTMNHFDPDKGELASQYHPLIGLYDSQDPDVIEYQLLTMKIAGIDGVLIDWYGIDALWDYPEIHKASQLVFAATKKFGMKFGVVYEDQTLKHMIAQKVVQAEAAISVGIKTMKWLEKNWFGAPHYLKVNEKPALLVFGPQYYKPEAWATLLSGINVSFFTLHHQRGNAIGGYDWPIPGGGTEGCEKERLEFLDRAKQWPTFVAGAYPRFVDIYAKAGLSSYPLVSDLDGETFRRTMASALEGKAPVVQIATWNDWGEGTQIEPSKEFGYRDLEATQMLRKKYLDPSFSRTGSDLRLPDKLYQLRKAGKAKSQLDQVARMISLGDTKKAAMMLAEFQE